MDSSDVKGKGLTGLSLVMVLYVFFNQPIESYSTGWISFNHVENWRLLAVWIIGMLFFLLRYLQRFETIRQSYWDNYFNYFKDQLSQNARDFYENDERFKNQSKLNPHLLNQDVNEIKQKIRRQRSDNLIVHSIGSVVFSKNIKTIPVKGKAEFIRKHEAYITSFLPLILASVSCVFLIWHLLDLFFCDLLKLVTTL